MQFILFLFLVFCVFSGCFMCSTPDTKVISCTYSPTTNKITGGAVYGGGFFDWVRSLFKSRTSLPEQIILHKKTYIKKQKDNTSPNKCLFCKTIKYLADYYYSVTQNNDLFHYSCLKQYLDNPIFPDVKINDTTYYAMSNSSTNKNTEIVNYPDDENFIVSNNKCNLCHCTIHLNDDIMYLSGDNTYHNQCFTSLKTNELINYVIQENLNLNLYINNELFHIQKRFNVECPICPSAQSTNLCNFCNNQIVKSNIRYYYNNIDKCHILPIKEIKYLHVECVNGYKKLFT